MFKGLEQMRENSRGVTLNEWPFGDINQTLKARFHNKFCNVLNELGEVENQQLVQQIV